MAKAANIFNDYYDIQESWIRRQIDNLKSDSFVDLSLAKKKEVEDAGLVAFIDLKSIDQSREKHFSKAEEKKLSAILRIYKKRKKNTNY